MSNPLKKPAANPLRHLRSSDVRAVAKLTTQSITSIHGITEGVHQAVLGTLGFPLGAVPGRTGGVTGLVYKTLHGVTQLVAKSIDAPLAALQPLLDRLESERPATPGREVAIAILNGGSATISPPPATRWHCR